MNEMMLNGVNMLSRAAAHDEIARALELPDYYGRNLDALWDMATTMHAHVALLNPAPMLNALGVYGCKLLQTLFEAAQQNPHFHFELRA